MFFGNDTVCKGMLVLGTGCMKCTRCVDQLRAKVTELEAENIRLKIQASGAPSGLIDGELHELIAARGRIAELEAALRPFAKCEACRLGRIPPSEQWLYKPSTRKREMRSISFQNVIDARIALGLNTETGDALASTDEPKRGEE